MKDLMVVDSQVFQLETVKRALYRFADRLSFDISQEGENINIRIRVNPGYPEDNWDGLIRNALLDQSLRDSIGTETREIRNLILANAFSKTCLVE